MKTPFQIGGETILTFTSLESVPVPLYLISKSRCAYQDQWQPALQLTLVLLNPDISGFCKQCRSRSVGFWRSQLIWIYTVCNSVCEFISAIWIKSSGWLKIWKGCGFLIYSTWQGLNMTDAHIEGCYCSVYMPAICTVKQKFLYRVSL